MIFALEGANDQLPCETSEQHLRCAKRQESNMSRLVQWLFPGVLVVASAAGCNQPPPTQVEPPPPEVEVSKPLVKKVTDYEETTGRTDAIESVQLRARVSGYLTRINFKDGDDVTAGQILFE